MVKDLALKPTQPGTVEFTLTVTMSLDEWKQIRECLSGEQPKAHFGPPFRDMTDAIDSMVNQATKQFGVEGES